MKPLTRNIVLASGVGVLVLLWRGLAWQVPVDARLWMNVAILGLFLVSLLLAVFGFTRGRATEGGRAAVPLVIDLAVIALVATGVPSRLTIGHEFRAHYDERVKAIAVARGVEQPGLDPNAPIAEVDPAGTCVRFLVTPGCDGQCWSGFVYMVNDDVPRPINEANAVSYRKLEDHWFWVEELP